MSLENLRTLSKLKKYACTTCLKKNVQPLKKKLSTHIFWVWREFGDSPNSFFHFFWKMRSSKDFFVSLERVWNEFGVSLERVWRISKHTPNSQRNLCLMLFFIFFGKKRKNEFGPNSLQTQRNMCAQLFFKKKCACSHSKKLCTHNYFSWVWKDFGDSPNSFFLFLFLFWKMTSSKDFFVSLKWAPNSYVFIVFCDSIVSLEKRNEFGVSLEILQTLPKLAPSSYFFFVSHLFLGEKRNEFGVSLEIFQTLSKLISNSLQTQMMFIF